MTYSAIGDILLLAVAVGWPAANRRRWQQQFARAVYRGVAARYDSTRIAGDPAYGAALAAALRRLDGGFAPRRVLDIATGTGFVALAVAQQCRGAVIFVCDLSKEMLRQAAANAARGGYRISLVQATNGALPYRDNCFDLVAVQNAPPPLKEMVRVLAPGGIMIVCLSSGAGAPDWLLAALRRRLARFGIAEVTIGRTERGLYVLGRNGLEPERG